MTYEYVSQFFMLLLALLLGAFIGCMLRRWTRTPSSQTDVKSPAPSQSQAAPDEVSAVMESAKTEEPVAVTAVAEEPPAPAPAPAPDPEPAAKPVQARGLEAAIGGKADDLKTISGIGPKLEQTLNSLGIFHFEQIASWSAQDVSEVDDLLSFKGRVERDDWIAQAKKLMDD